MNGKCCWGKSLADRQLMGEKATRPKKLKFINFSTWRSQFRYLDRKHILFSSEQRMYHG